eukprot:TRINITY_DN9000_c0_g1_i5.p1 TRINITY_DN9000_c0_g1~~TRINITY_DN9000_c0_g1_i5.p1  ORF type:complete len:137 (-),score=35.35 TRINITY_DN9000_c0_g1_i5:227-637(-)
MCIRDSNASIYPRATESPADPDGGADGSGTPPMQPVIPVVVPAAKPAKKKLKEATTRKSAKSLAGYIMKQADRHCRNGRLTLNELQTFLPRHGFTRWMSKNRGQMFKVDRNRDGSIGIEELRQACSQFLEEEADRS